MNKALFIELLKREGFSEFVEVKEKGNRYKSPFSHPYEAKALVIKGEIKIDVWGVRVLYGPGEIFHLEANMKHAEKYGLEDVEYLMGFKRNIKS